MGKAKYNVRDKRQMNKAMRLSFVVGIFMLFLKMYAFFLTGSTAILSDATESVVHVFAVGFAAYSMWLSHKPADDDHTYGHDRITFFSAGFEGGLIMIAAVYIIYQASLKFIHGVTIENIDSGMIFISLATVLNGLLGFYLVKKGKKYHSLVLEADGKHILTDCMTSLGVILALVLTKVTGWVYFDPIVALFVGINILWTGSKLIYNSFQGLMDRVEPKMHAQILKLLKSETENFGIRYHHLRHRNAGNRLLIEVHLLFPNSVSLTDAHEVATNIEKRMETHFDRPTEMITHLEPLEGHDEIHRRLLGRLG